MKKVAFAFALVFFAFTMSSCVHVAYGPSDNITDAGYVHSAQAAVDSGETIHFMDKAYFLANTPKPGHAQTWGAFGTVVGTDKTLYFLFWNRNINAFDVLRKIPVANMVDVAHISSPFGPGDYVSIEDKDHRFDLFSCYEMHSATSPVDKNRKLLHYLDAVRNSQQSGQTAQ